MAIDESMKLVVTGVYKNGVRISPPPTCNGCNKELDWLEEFFGCDVCV
jgi:hypothetical protein